LTANTPPPREPLSGVDHAWLRMDHPTNLMMINGVLVLDQRVDAERLRQTFRERLLPIRRFHQKVVRPADGGHPYWEEDADFELNHHLVEAVLPAPGDDAALKEVINGLMSSPLDPARPLWQFHLLSGYQGHASVLLGRLHHCIGDGVGLLLVLLSLTDLHAEGAGVGGAGEVNPFTTLLSPGPQTNLEEARRLAEKVMPDGMNLLLKPFEALQATNPWLKGAAATAALSRLTFLPPDPRTRFRGKLTVPKRVAWSRAIPISEVKLVQQQLGGTINDVLLAAMTGALRRYLDRFGPVPSRLNFRAAMPVSLRPLEKMAELGNEFGLAFLSLPVGLRDAGARLAELARRSSRLKRSVDPIVVLGLLKAIGLAPRAIQNLVVDLFAMKTTAVMTNVPGPRDTLYLAGKPIRDIIFWVPQAGKVGLGISIFSYAGHVRLGVGTDAGLVPDPEVIVEEFHQEFAEMHRG
jgi:diacylglycerol O-acyltransferase